MRTFARNLRTSYTPGAAFAGPVRLVLAGYPAQDPVLIQAKQQKTMEAWRNWAPSALVWRSRANHMAILREPHLAVWTEAFFTHPVLE